MEEIELVKKIFLIIEENSPDDCRDLIIKKLKEKIIKDIKDLGIEKAIGKWMSEGEEDEEIVIVN
ncbi:MAG: hypothetical protein RRA45_10175 [Saccharolobus sp.]|jgi:hypothetical protein|uniref:hypothetical protein n=1 Tax=Saccharolobus sp. TaxID=2100761 RepID=UPI0028CE8409|nr:hypothetical protein [Saccharolobus sp.]MDT7862563.1 hypothetical protein [Saccharolobus sp.]